MNQIPAVTFRDRAEDVLVASSSRRKTVPVYALADVDDLKTVKALTAAQKKWAQQRGFSVTAPVIALPDEHGELAAVVLLLPQSETDDYAAFEMGRLARLNYDVAFEVDTGGSTAPISELNCVAFGLGRYVFSDYRSAERRPSPTLKLPADIDSDRTRAAINAVYFGRDLINTPANDLGPDELEHAARSLASHYKAKFAVTKGEQLLKKNFPLIHTVGRASPREPRLLDITWGRKSHPKVTLVGKGIVFDTGGLNLKPGASMTLMKKDMGGSAAVLTLAALIMAAGLPICLRVLIAVAENSVSGNAFRPGDVLPSRNGMTVEIGNTDAEGRLVLADALSLADEESPELLMSFATLTGAARVALGPDLPPAYSTDDDLAATIARVSRDTCDPVWHMPFWQPYDAMLASEIADVNHITNNGYAGSVTAALFLKRFVENAGSYTHFDIFGWTPSAKPARPKGGEPQAARAVFEVLRQKYG